jgi:hypothetical protein
MAPTEVTATRFTSFIKGMSRENIYSGAENQRCDFAEAEAR